MTVFIRLYIWHRKSGASVRHALRRAWAKAWEPDSFQPTSKRKT